MCEIATSLEPSVTAHQVPFYNKPLVILKTSKSHLSKFGLEVEAPPFGPPIIYFNLLSEKKSRILFDTFFRSQG